MENASKALIIAGAILISIILISIGIMIVQSANGLIDNGNETMNAQELQAFNSKFDVYVGPQKGSSIKTLMGIVRSSNATFDEDHQVAVEGPNNETTVDEISNNIKATTTYTVSIESAKSGLIKKIIISTGSSGTTSKSST